MDVFGKAIAAFNASRDDTLEIEVASELAGDELIPVAYFFRDFEEMPDLEQKALTMAKGKVLDVGAGAGSHSLYLQEERGLEVVALEKSTLACDVLEDRGVQEVIEDDFYQFNQETFDTILLLMNGIGMAGTLENLPKFLVKCRELLKKGGSVLIESSDIIYMFEDQDGSYVIDLNGAYYGNMNYTVSFEEDQENFNWLYVAYDLLADTASECGFKIRKVQDGESMNYLAELKLV